MNIIYMQDLPAPLAERLQFGIGAAARVWCTRHPASELIAQCEVVIGGTIPRDFLDAATRLQYQIIPYAGVPQKTREILRDYPHITVLNSHFNAQVVAEHAWALLLAAAKRIIPPHELLRQGNWSPRYAEYPSWALQGKTLLLLGYGAIGRALARMGTAFNMRVMAISRTGPALDGLVDGGALAELTRLLPQADAILVTLPTTDATAGLIDEKVFDQMKPGVLFVNVGRATVVNEAAFHGALASGRIGAAGIDTWWHYPPDPADPTASPPSRFDLAAFDQLVMSPHRASHVAGRETARTDAMIETIRSILRGDPINCIDLCAGY